MQLLFWLLLFAPGLFSELELQEPTYFDLEAFELFRCRSFAVSNKGTLFLVDRDSSQPLLLDDRGRLLGRIGKQGAGPGELRQPFEVCWVPLSGHFALLDFGNNRFSFWAPDGSFIREVPAQLMGLGPQTRDGRTFFYKRDAFGNQTGQATLMSYDVEKNTRAEVWAYPLDENHVFSTGINNGQTIQVMYRWDPSLIFALGGSFNAVAFGSRPRVFLLDGEGKDVGLIRFEMPRHPVSETQLQSGIELLPAPLHKSLEAGLIKPDGWPYLRNMVIDEADRILIVGGNPDVGKPHPLVVYDRAGKLLGRSQVAGMVQVASGGYLYFLTEGEEALRLGKVAYHID